LLLACAAACMASPADWIEVLRVVPHADLTQLDPVFLHRDHPRIWPDDL
jgi:hypothetical protein